MNESKYPLSEENLILALKAGDNLAFRQVYREGYPLIEALIIKNGGSAEDGQDIFQEVLFVVIKKLRDRQFQLSCALNTYLYAVARNIWKTKLRSKRNNTEFKDTLHDFVDPTESETTIKKLFEKRHNIVRQLLEQLSEKCKKILVSFYYEKKSMREIGQAMQSAEAGIRVQKHRCMSYLKKKVEEHPDYRNLISDEL